MVNWQIYIQQKATVHLFKTKEEQVRKKETEDFPT